MQNRFRFPLRKSVNILSLFLNVCRKILKNSVNGRAWMGDAHADAKNSKTLEPLPTWMQKRDLDVLGGLPNLVLDRVQISLRTLCLLLLGCFLLAFMRAALSLFFLPLPTSAISQVDYDSSWVRGYYFRRPTSISLQSQKKRPPTRPKTGD